MIGQLDSEILYLRENMGEYGSVVKTDNSQGIEEENKEILKSFTSDQVSLKGISVMCDFIRKSVLYIFDCLE